MVTLGAHLILFMFNIQATKKLPEKLVNQILNVTGGGTSVLEKP